MVWGSFCSQVRRSAFLWLSSKPFSFASSSSNMMTTEGAEQTRWSRQLSSEEGVAYAPETCVVPVYIKGSEPIYVARPFVRAEICWASDKDPHGSRNWEIKLQSRHVRPRENWSCLRGGAAPRGPPFLPVQCDKSRSVQDEISSLRWYCVALKHFFTSW